MEFRTIHTSAGLELLSQAQSSGVQINLTDMAVGDGNGNPVMPTEGQAGLVRERYRAAVNRVYKPDPVNFPTMFAAELVIPASEGGFTMREVGVFDEDGTLFAVGNLPETYKPADGDGAYTDTIVRIDFLASNADIITVQVDPNVIVATRQWVTNNVTAASLLPGGLTDQVLAKASNADGDVVWKDPAETNVIVSTVEETQTLADGQTQVNLAVTNTAGLAVYIEGVRIPKGATADGWQPDGTDATVLTLGKSYPAGTQFFAVQNEPNSDYPEPLERSQNFADLENAATARQNLDVYSRAQTDQKAPAGMVAHFARNTAPVGWIKANGAEVSRTVYADLFNAIGTTYGAGNGVDTFNLPDLRGEFVRGWDDGRGVDAGRAFGSAQGDEIREHTHTLFGNDRGGFSGQEYAPGLYQDDAERAASDEGSIRPTGGSETRPRNVALLACVKY